MRDQAIHEPYLSVLLARDGGGEAPEAPVQISIRFPPVVVFFDLLLVC
jgi:hypothetical protein